MKCLPYESLQAYIDGELSKPSASELERHLKDCRACRETLGELRSASALVKERISHLGPAQIPVAPPLPIEGVRKPAQVSTWHRFLASSIRVPAAALAMAGLFVIGLALGTMLKVSPKTLAERAAGGRAERAQVSLFGADSVQILHVGLNLRNYKAIEHPSIFTIKE